VPRTFRSFPGPLRGIDAFWEHRGAAGSHRILPDGCIDFLFDLVTGEARVIGAMSAAKVVSLREGAHVFGIRFRPGVAFRYLDERADELLDRAPQLSEFRRGTFATLGARLAEAKSRVERRDAALSVLGEPGARWRGADARVERAVTLVESSRGRIAARSLAAEVGIGERQLERLFAERVGHGPKLFARVVRLHHAVGLASGARLRQAELAAAAGYADEPHLLRDFRDLAGITPRALTDERDVGFVQGEPANAR
jgi:AraC-like DNA-binding protein